MTRATIRRLDPLTIARIAAGEVVERPASVVKELLENSLDAGATTIEVEIAEGGARLIRVSDDGQGIPAGELALAFEQHSTSKLRRSEDLEAIASLGFRGEALASIAAVSHVTALSRPEGEGGARLRIDNGETLDLSPAGAPRGTSITVENLFNAVPARRKFLRQPATEAAQIQDLLARYAIAYPDIGFRLRSNGREVFRSSGEGGLDAALAAVLGAEAAAQMLPAEHAREDLAWPAGPLEVRGFVSPPHLHRATRRYLFLMVNGRPIQDARLSHAMREAYHGLIPKDRFPLAILQVTLPPQGVDVNVHPAKTELRFREPRAIYAAVQQAMRAAVAPRGEVAPAGRLEGEGEAPAPSAASPDPVAPDRPRPEFGRPSGRIAEPSGRWSRGSGGAAAPAPDRPAPAVTAPMAAPGKLPPLRVLGQIAKMYIAAEGPDGLCLIDQHAAHERVVYERFMTRGAQPYAQSLISPQAVSVPAALAAPMEAALEGLAALGLVLEPFGPGTVLLRAVPDAMAGVGDPADVLRDVLDRMAEGDAPIEEAFEARLVRMVCKRASVKAGQSLTLLEMQRLVEDLEGCESPLTCPHGRPTVIVIGLARLGALFGR